MYWKKYLYSEFIALDLKRKHNQQLETYVKGQYILGSLNVILQFTSISGLLFLASTGVFFVIKKPHKIELITMTTIIKGITCNARGVLIHRPVKTSVRYNISDLCPCDIFICFTLLQKVFFTSCYYTTLKFYTFVFFSIVNDKVGIFCKRKEFFLANRDCKQVNYRLLEAESFNFNEVRFKHGFSYSSSFEFHRIQLMYVQCTSQASTVHFTTSIFDRVQTF